MLKVSNVGRGRTNSFSLLDPSTPTPTPSSSYIPDTLLENRMVGLNNVGSEELLRAAEQFLLQPTRTEAKDAKEATRLRLVQEMCSEFLLTDEQLQHIEERMVMEVRDQISSSDFSQNFRLQVNWGLGADTNPSSNIKSYITYVSQVPSGEFRVTFFSASYRQRAWCLPCPGPRWHQLQGDPSGARQQEHQREDEGRQAPRQ